MDFFERQDRARHRTKILIVYFALAVAAIVGIVYLVVILAVISRHSHAASVNGLWNPVVFLWATGLTLGIIFIGSTAKTAELSKGGGFIAECMDGRLIAPNTTDPDEQRLINVVDEMSIASGINSPQIFVIDSERGINAFAAGHDTADAAVVVSNGALRLLDRDELQGVIAHEFSHILNGDMRLNLRLTGIVFGIICLAIIGKTVIRVGADIGTNSRNLKAGGFILVGLLAGFVMLAIGSLGSFFGKLIRSAISRQREFLADASAVQFTRNPAGLSNALKKIGGLSLGSWLTHNRVEEISHLFFSNAMKASWFSGLSTHPPLEDRIRALEPDWDGQFITPQIPADFERQSSLPATSALRPMIGSVLALTFSDRMISTSTASVLLQTGAPTPQHLVYAADWRSQLSAEITASVGEPFGAVALIYAMLLSREEAMRAMQLQLLQSKVDAPIFKETVRLIPFVIILDSRTRLPLAGLTMAQLRRLSPPQYAQFSASLRVLIESDGKLELFEYALQKIVLRQLEPSFKAPAKPVIQYYVLKPLLPDCAALLSALAYAGHAEPAEVTKAFHQGATRLGVPELALAPSTDCALPKFDAALERLNQATPQLKKLVLYACAETAAMDGVILEDEAELLRAIADTLGCPIPPFISIS